MKREYEYLSEDPNVKIWPIVVSLIIGAFFSFLNETLLNIALITLMEEFSVDVTTVQWMVTGFMLVMGVVMPASALIMQWFTTRQMFFGTMIMFTVGTTVCALAPTFPVLVVGRFLQAAGTGLLMPLIFNTFLLLFPPKRRGTVMGFVGLVMMFAPAIGPTLSGIIVEYLGWRYLFITVIPFCLFSIVFAFKYLMNVSEVTKPNIDVISLVYSTVGFGGVVYAFSTAGEGDATFSSPAVYLPLFFGILALVLFSIRQYKLEEPVLDITVFKFPMFTLGIVLFLIVLMAMFSSEIILPIYMQEVLALSAAASGLILLPGSLVSGLMSPFMGRLFDHLGPRKIIIPATLLLSVTMFAFSRFGLQTPVWMIIVGYILLLVSVSGIMMPAETNGLNELPKRYYPHGTAMMSTLQPVFGAIGVSLFVSLLSARQNHFLTNSENPADPETIKNALVAGVELVYFISLGLSVLAFLISLFIYRAMPEEEIEHR